MDRLIFLNAGLTLQAILGRALQENKYAIMSSIDLSSAFNVVNIELLVKRLKILGLPDDIAKLIEHNCDIQHYL